VGVLAAQGQQIVEWNAEFMLGVSPKVRRDEGRHKTVKAGSHRRVGREEIPGARHGQCDIEGLAGLAHKTPGTFQYGKGRMSFIQVADVRLETQHVEQPPAPDPQD